ncbi:unnamed protein product [Effrenium voratum]|nr:unnamed protein product [Effrenium voratum]
MPSDRQDEANQSETWARVYDELRSQQSLASVINDPFRGSRLLRGQWDGLGEFVGTVWESVEELNDQRETEGIDPAVLARIDALIGPVPEASELQPYLDTFADVWDVYHRNHRRKSRWPNASAREVASSSRGPPEDDDLVAAREAHFAVPPEYFSTSFSLEQHPIFRQSLETAVDRQEDLHAELSGYMDMVEVSLFEHIRKAQQDRLFDSLASLGEPLQQDLSGALAVVRTLRGHLKEVQKLQLQCGLAVGRLERRKRRVQDVLQKLDCLEHVRQCRPSIQMLLQGRDFITALDLIDSTTSALESKLKGLVSVKSTWSQLLDFGDTFDRAVEAEFVHLSSESLLQQEDEHETGQEDEIGDLRLRPLCQCLALRGRLRAALNPTLRDVVLSQLKKAIKLHTKFLLQELEEVAGDQEAGDSLPLDGASPKDETASQAPETVPAEAEAKNVEGAAPGITSALCVLAFDKFVDFWRRLLGFVLVMATRYSRYACQVQAIAAEAHAVNANDSEEVALELCRLLEVILAQALKIAGALLQARQKEHQSLKVRDWQNFLRLTNSLLGKVDQVQQSCQIKVKLGDHVGVEIQASLRAITHSQTKNIIEEFHQKCLLQTTQVLEQERWDRTDVPVQYKKILRSLLGHERPTPRISRIQNACSTQRELFESICKPDRAKLSDAGGAADEDADQPAERYLHVEGTQYQVVPAALTLLQLLADYVQLCHDFSEMTAEVVQRMCQLLRLFNHRAQRMILNGQAVQHKVLPRITAANLALSSQCCGLMAQVLPLLQTQLGASGESHGNAQAAARGAMVVALLGDLSKIASEFAEHRSALFGKLSDLLRVQYEKHSQRWLKDGGWGCFQVSSHVTIPCLTQLLLWLRDWIVDGRVRLLKASQVPHCDTGGADIWKGDAMAALQGESSLGEHESLEGLVKDITAMYRVLLRNLNYDSVRKIFARAFEEIASSFQQRLEQDISAPSPPYSDSLGRSLGDRLLLDFAYLYRELEKLTGITTPLQRLLCDLVQHLQTKLPEDPPKKLHPVVLEALQRAGRLPQ